MLKNKSITLLTGIFVLGVSLFANADEVKNPQAQSNIQVQVHQEKTQTNKIPLHDEANKTDVLAVPAASSEEEIDEEMEEMEKLEKPAAAPSQPAATTPATPAASK